MSQNPLEVDGKHVAFPSDEETVIHDGSEVSLGA